MKQNVKVKNLIPRCGADSLLPLALVFMFYVILHGHLTPGGGFQGGVLAVAVVVLLYLGHGYQTTARALNANLLGGLEGLAVTLYIGIALLGVAFGVQFCQNIAYMNGDIGALISSGTISWMDEAVGLNVLTGVSVLAVTMVGLVAGLDDGKE